MTWRWRLIVVVVVFTVAFDSFPDMSEYPNECVYATDLHYANGRVVGLFDAACPGTTALHFKWLHDYGLHGVFLQRFLGEVTRSFAAARAPWWLQRNAVLRNVMDQAKAWGRVFALEYDISGEDPNSLFDDITADYQFLVSSMGMTASPNYIHHVPTHTPVSLALLLDLLTLTCGHGLISEQDGKPVVVIWGMGFTDRKFEPDTCLRVINWFKSQGVRALSLSLTLHWWVELT
jgi:hypothetical protein